MVKKVLQDKKMVALYLFFIVYFFCIGITTYSSKFYGEIGLNDSQIGLISALPAFVSLFAQPIWGNFSDRAKYKKNVVTFALMGAAIFAMLVQPCGGQFIPLLIVLTVMNTFTLPILPVTNAISLEYTRETGHDFGPVRLMGTLGYQLIILIAGFIFTASLNGLYTGYGILLITAALCSRLLPPVRGYQHGKKKVSFTVFFRDKNLMLLFLVGFLAHLCSQFYLTFFSKHLGSLGFSNSLTGIITTLSVSLEIPFLIFGDKLMRKMSIWRWMWVGLIVNGVRFIALSIVKAPALIVTVSILSVAQLSCFEFFPAIYLSKAVSKELRGSAQNAYNLLACNTARIIGTLAGGVIANATSIATVFGMCGCLLLAASVVMAAPLNHRAKNDIHRD